jgi:excinuclease ABC subunit B
MYNGDRSRKETLVEHGFRLPSALDNRPLRFDEWEELVKRAIFVSATPEQYEIAKSENEVVEQVIRPTGLVDPKVTVHQTTNQIKHLTLLIRERMKRKERVLVTTLTKRLAEDLSEHLEDENILCTYLHSEIDTIERVDILRSLRQGNFDVLVGVNLLREGLDLPEVSLVAILDADKEGFLRSETALVQTIGRTARNVNGEVILYADTITGSMKRAIAETDRRRKIQMAYNKKHNITPTTIQKGIYRGIEELMNANKVAKEALSLSDENFGKIESVRELQRQMYEAAAILDFEHAAKIRDEILRLRGIAPEQPAVALQKSRFARFRRRRRL